MRQDGQNVALQGVAQSNERVSELLRNLGNNSPWFSRPELVEIVAGTVTLTPRDLRRVANFNIKVSLVRASEAGKVVPVSAPAAASRYRLRPRPWRSKGIQHGNLSKN